MVQVPGEERFSSNVLSPLWRKNANAVILGDMAFRQEERGLLPMSRPVARSRRVRLPGDKICLLRKKASPEGPFILGEYLTEEDTMNTLEYRDTMDQFHSSFTFISWPSGMCVKENTPL